MKMDYMLQAQIQTHVYTDHRTILFAFAPLALEPALGHHIVSKVQRWALFLSRFPYIIEHVSGTGNVLVDMMTRWTKGYGRNACQLRTVARMLLSESKQLIPSPDQFEWPTPNSLCAAQTTARTRPRRLTKDPTDNLWKCNGRIWIPESDQELQLQLLVAAHSVVVGHRGIDATGSIFGMHSGVYLWIATPPS